MPCGQTGVTCTKQVTVTIAGTTIVFLRGRDVHMNDNPVVLPYNTETMQLMRRGLMTVLMVKSDQLEFTLEWDGSESLATSFQEDIQMINFQLLKIVVQSWNKLFVHCHFDLLLMKLTGLFRKKTFQRHSLSGLLVKVLILPLYIVF